MSSERRHATSRAVSSPHVTYKIIPASPEYRVGDDGSVWSSLSGTWKLLTQVIDHKGRPKVTLVQNGKQKQFKVCLLVASAFLGPRPVGTICLHWNDDPADNRLVNLRWGTYADNAQDSLRNGTKAIGERHGCAKLTSDKVLIIRQCGLSIKEITKEFGIGPSQAKRILNREAWRHLP